MRRASVPPFPLHHLGAEGRANSRLCSFCTTTTAPSCFLAVRPQGAYPPRTSGQIAESPSVAPG